MRRLIWLAMVALYVAFGLLGVIFLAPNTFVGADLATYQRASHDLWFRGDPYLSAIGAPYNFQYRYPPLLAMLIPVLGWPPLWFAILGASTALVFYYWYRDAGWLGLLPITMLAGAWGQPLINGNVQPVLMAGLALVPRYRRVGAVALAVGTMLKLHPVLGLIWYAGRRDWQALRWYIGASAALLLVQVPWLADFVRYYTTNPDSSPTLYEGFGLRLFGDIPWLTVTAVLGVVAFWFANGRLGWFANLVFQLVALPRLLPTNLALLLSAPFRSRPSMSGATPAVAPAETESEVPLLRGEGPSR